jgi:hypothetical protein
MGFVCESANVPLLREAFRHVMEKHPFTIDAVVLLPDHLHCLWTLTAIGAVNIGDVANLYNLVIFGGVSLIV